MIEMLRIFSMGFLENVTIEELPPMVEMIYPSEDQPIHKKCV